MISVITPVYNGEKFIESCIKNVMEQSCSNCEHIIVDGASTDDTVAIIREYARQYSHIRWISEPDRGQSDAMNKGINLAEGEIIAILNVDDFYEPNVLNRVSEIFKTLPIPSFLVGNCQVWDEQGKLLYINKPKKLSLQDLLLGINVNPHPVNPSAYFYHKLLHEKIGFYSIEEDYIMDLDFILQAVQVANVKYVNQNWGNYRYIQGTKTFDDAINGQNIERYQKLLNNYSKTLPIMDRLNLLFTKNVFSRIKYFYRHPQDLFPSIGNKLKLLSFLLRKPNK